MRAFLRLFPALLLALPLLGSSGCSERVDTAEAGPDSTTVYRAKDGESVEASILFYRAKSKKSGRLIGEDGPFTVKEKSKVRARISLSNTDALGERGGMFHLVWVDPEGKEFYTKRIDWSPEDGEEELSGSISAYPGKRDPGEYLLRVYLFRELIAEKGFLLESEEETDAREKAEKAARSESSKKKSPKKKSSKKKSGKKSGSSES